jgi:hypothetical protein
MRNEMTANKQREAWRQCEKAKEQKSGVETGATETLVNAERCTRQDAPRKKKKVMFLRIYAAVTTPKPTY